MSLVARREEVGIAGIASSGRRRYEVLDGASGSYDSIPLA
jgi:hypothetical protein